MPELKNRPGRRRLFLMRHGHVDYFAAQEAGESPRNVRLTEEGIAQAEAAAEALSGCHLDFALCSGLPRTRQTAEIILSQQSASLPLQENLALEEIQGAWADIKNREELVAKIAFSFETAAQPGATMLPGGEPYLTAYARGTAAIFSALTAGDWSRGLIVAHEGMNRLILSWACRGGLASMAAFEQDLGCINVIDADIVPCESGDGLAIERIILKAINITPYDAMKHGLARTSLEALFGV